MLTPKNTPPDKMQFSTKVLRIKKQINT